MEKKIAFISHSYCKAVNHLEYNWTHSLCWPFLLLALKKNNNKNCCAREQLSLKGNLFHSLIRVLLLIHIYIFLSINPVNMWRHLLDQSKNEWYSWDWDPGTGCRALLLSPALCPASSMQAEAGLLLLTVISQESRAARGRHSRTVCKINERIKEWPSNDYSVWRGSL